MHWNEPYRKGDKNFTVIILEELKIAGVQRVNMAAKIIFTRLKPWPGRFINGEGVCAEGEQTPSLLLIGPEFGSGA
jgi:adenine-specific DNA-methyltransferase